MNLSFDYSIFTHLFFFCILIAATIAALHAITHKRNARSAFSWVVLILVWPLFGAIVYYYFGINRISRKMLKQKPLTKRSIVDARSLSRADTHYSNKYRYKSILTCSDNLGCPPLAFSVIDLSHSGDEAYKKMLAAIASAQQSISLYTYIFAYDEVGDLFCEALIAAHRRGVEVRFLIDAVGSSKGRRKILQRFHEANIKAAAFLPVLWRSNLSNLRNHRKLLIIDGIEAFTGGLNIGKIYWEEKSGDKAVTDFNCSFRGEIVHQLQEVFADDWFFTTNEVLGGHLWFPDCSVDLDHTVLTRLIVAGPVFQEERIHWHFLNAINVAEKNLRIATPYFLPDESTIFALCSAALRGVCVEILIPKDIDHKVMNWALNACLLELLFKGCHVYRTYPLFDHSKLLIVDDDYTSVGSANWDARSFRLNFELNVGVIDTGFTTSLIEMFEEKKKVSRPFLLEDIKRRNVLKKVRDGVARMLTPYL